MHKYEARRVHQDRKRLILERTAFLELDGTHTIQDFGSIWRKAMGRSEHAGDNEREKELCSIVDFQHAVNDFLQEGDESIYD